MAAMVCVCVCAQISHCLCIYMSLCHHAFVDFSTQSSLFFFFFFKLHADSGVSALVEWVCS